MNSKLQYTKLSYRNLLSFYMLIMNYQKEKNLKTLFKIASRRIKKKITMNKMNQGG